MLQTSNRSSTALVELDRSYPSTDRKHLLVLSRKLQALLDDPSVTRLVVDLAGAPNFGAGLLGVLTKVHRLAERRGQQLALCNVPDHGKDLLRITNLDRVLEISDSRRAALRGETYATVE